MWLFISGYSVQPQVSQYFVTSTAPLDAFLRRYFAGGVCTCTTKLYGKVIIITGANRGIGKATAIELAKRGAHVILACRDLVAAEKTRQDIVKETGNSDVRCLYLDLNSFQSIKQFVCEFTQEERYLHILINNAGTFYHPKELTEDGFDVTFQTNYLGHFLLTVLLLDILKQSSPSRIINLASQGYQFCSEVNFDDINLEKDYGYFKAYGQAKLCILLFTAEIAQRLRGTGVIVYAVHPGNVETSIYRHFPYLRNPVLYAVQKPIRLLVIKSPLEGAQTVLHCALQQQENSTGKYFIDCQERVPSTTAQDIFVARKLWLCSLQWTGLHEQALDLGIL